MTADGRTRSFPLGLEQHHSSEANYTSSVLAIRNALVSSFLLLVTSEVNEVGLGAWSQLGASTNIARGFGAPTLGVGCILKG